MIRHWLRAYALQAADTDDLVQEVLGVLVRELPHFQPGRPGAFRRWLRTITVNRLRAFWRAERVRPLAADDFDRTLQQLEDSDSDLSKLWDQEHDQHVVRRLLELIQPEFEPATWRAFGRLMLEGRPTAEVAAELGVSANAVRIAKSCVLSRFRQEVAGLLD